MKKILFASTALVAAGLLTSGSADAAEKINLQLAGYSKWWVVGAWQSNDYLEHGSGPGVGGNNAAHSYNNTGIKGDNEIWFTGSTTLNNGLKVGITVELEAGGHTDQTTDVIDRSWVWVEGGFGKVQAGTNKNAAYLLAVQAPDAAGNWTHDGIITGNYAIVKPGTVNSMAGGNTTMINETDSAESISYFTPSFYGLTVGVSYLPRGPVEDNRNFVDFSTDSTTAANRFYMRDGVAVGALYANTIGGVGVKVSGGAFESQVNTTGQAFANSKSFFDWSAGVNLSYAGFTLGTSYRQQRQDNGAPGAAPLATAASGTIGNGKAWDAGLQYATGPFAVSFAYFNSSVDRTNGGADDKVHIYQLSGKYNLGPGVDILGTAGYAEYKSAATDTATLANSNSGWTVMSGLSLTF